MEAPQVDPLEGFKSDIISNDTVRIKVYDDNTDDGEDDDLQDEDIEYEDIELPEPTEQNDYTKLISQAGLAAIDQGLPVFLLQPTKRKSPYRTCDPCKTNHTTKELKEACQCLLCHGFYAATTDKDKFLEMVRAHPFGLLAYRTGGISMTFVVDIDPRNGGIESLQALESKYGKIPDTVRNDTASGGWHLRLSVPIGESIRCLPQFAPGIDIKGDGGYAILPPSTYGAGTYQEVSTGIPPGPDDWLLKLIKEKASNSFGGAPVDYQNLPKYNELNLREQNRNNNYALSALDRIAEQLRALGSNDEWNNSVYFLCCNAVEIVNNPGNEFNLDHARQLVLENSPQDPGFTTEDINRCFDSAINSVGKKCRVPKDIHIKRPWNDIGNAQRMRDGFGNIVRWVTDAQKWYVYDSKRWILNNGELVRTLVHQMMKDMLKTEALGYPDDDDDGKGTSRDKFIEWAKAQQSSSKIDNCIKEMKAIPQMRALIDDFNKRHDLYNCNNGTINLRTGELMPHDPRHMFTQITYVDYHGLDVPAPQWTKFLETVQPNPNRREYLQKSSGYDLTGYTIEQKFHTHSGEGGNGKSQYFEAVATVMGEYACWFRVETFLEYGSQFDKVPNDIAKMVGIRLIYTGEPKKNRPLNESLINTLTGDGKQQARFMGKDFFEFEPTANLHFCVNQIPNMSTSHAIWRRFRNVKWDVKIPEKDRVFGIGKKIATAEGSGILAWLVRGAMKWFKEGLGDPDFLNESAAEVRSSMHPLTMWMEDCLDINHSVDFIKRTEYYKSYVAWANQDRTIQQLAISEFYKALENEKPRFEAKRRSSGLGFRGPKIVDAEPDIQINYR